MDTFWLIIFIVFLVVKSLGKNQGRKSKTLNRQPWDEIRRLQRQFFPEENIFPPANGLPDQETGPVFDQAGSSAEWWETPLEVLPKTAAAAGDATQIDSGVTYYDSVPGAVNPVNPILKAIPVEIDQEQVQNFQLFLQPSNLIQGIILAEILQSPGGKSRAGRR